MVLQYLPRRILLRRFKLLIVASCIFGTLHFLIHGQPNYDIYKPTEEILIREKRNEFAAHPTPGHFRARIQIDKLVETSKMSSTRVVKIAYPLKIFDL